MKRSNTFSPSSPDSIADPYTTICDSLEPIDHKSPVRILSVTQRNTDFRGNVGYRIKI